MSEDNFIKFCFVSCKKVAYVVGCINLVVRLGGTIAVAILLSKLEESENLFIVAYSILLSYIAFSLTLVIPLLIGIYKEYSWCLLPYISLNFIEIIMLLIIAITGITFIILVEIPIYFAYFVPGLIIVLGIAVFSWLSIFKLFVEFDSKPQVE